jgi:hypothetical protein
MEAKKKNPKTISSPSVDGDIEVDLRFLPRFEVLRPGAKIYYGV